jgi:TonB family protein
VGVKAWFAATFRVVAPDPRNTAATIRQLTPVFHSGEVTAGSIREHRLKVLVNPMGQATLVSGQTIDPKVMPAISQALGKWKFDPPRIDGVPGFGEIDVPLLFALSEERTAYFTPAVMIQQTLPVRPRWMRLLGMGEQNRVRVKIGKDGTVLEAVQLDPTWSSAYNEDVVRSVKTWRFSPEVRNGVAVETSRIVGFGRPPPPPAPLDPPDKGAAGLVMPPHANKTIGFQRRPDSAAVQIRITIDKTGAVRQTLIERAADIAYANELVARYRGSQWDPATENGAPAEYTFRVRQ